MARTSWERSSGTCLLVSQRMEMSMRMMRARRAGTRWVRLVRSMRVLGCLSGDEGGGARRRGTLRSPGPPSWFCEGPRTLRVLGPSRSPLELDEDDSGFPFEEELAAEGGEAVFVLFD